MLKKPYYEAVKDALDIGYTATVEGIVYNPRGKKIGSIQGDGYVKMAIPDSEGQYHHQYAHRFIWTAFNGEIEPGYDINHINHKKSDNRLENLECISHRENMQHTAKMGMGGGGRGVAKKKSTEKLEASFNDSKSLLVDLWKALGESRKGIRQTDEEFDILWDRLTEILKVR